MRHRSIAAVALMAAACVPPKPAPPAPVALTVALTPAAAVSRATRAATLLGYTPIVADGTGGTLVTVRRYEREGHAVALVCAFGRGSVAERHLVAQHRVTVSAVPRGDSTALVVRGEVEASYPTLTGVMARAPNAVDCQSRGGVESAIADSVRAGP